MQWGGSRAAMAHLRRWEIAEGRGAGRRARIIGGRARPIMYFKSQSSLQRDIETRHLGPVGKMSAVS